MADLIIYAILRLVMHDSSEFRISLAGAQEKTGFLWHQGEWMEPHGVTPTSHIFKLSTDLRHSVENEWLCLEILKTFGLPVNNADVTQYGEMKVLIVERFDRRWRKNKLLRLPQEDICQALEVPLALKHESDGGPGIEQIMKLLSGSHRAKEDRERFMRSVFLFWVMGAVDGHAKNFSIFINAGGSYQLTPRYDVVSGYPIFPIKAMKMAMALNGKNKHYSWHDIQLRHWFETAKHCYFPKSSMQTIIYDVLENIEIVIKAVEKELPKGFSSEISQPIFDGMRQVRDKRLNS